MADECVRKATARLRTIRNPFTINIMKTMDKLLRRQLLFYKIY